MMDLYLTANLLPKLRTNKVLQMKKQKTMLGLAKATNSQPLPFNPGSRVVERKQSMVEVAAPLLQAEMPRAKNRKRARLSTSMMRNTSLNMRRRQITIKDGVVQNQLAVRRLRRKKAELAGQVR